MTTPNPPQPERQPGAASKTPSPPAAGETNRPTDSVPMATGSFGKLPLRFGRYQVQKLLGKGAMGAVYLARDTQLERQVALKIPKLSASARGSEKLLKRLKTEAMAAAQIDHPCVCPVHDSGDIDGTPYIAMQYIEGETLKDHLKNQVKTPQEAVELIRQLAEGLAEAHSRKIYHRDLKPENIKLNRRGVPVIMDFGLAKLATTIRSDASATQAGTTLGTPAYMSPEQANGQVALIDHRSDIYALGVMLYEMLTGQWPFSGSAVQVMALKTLLEPPSPLTVKPELNPDLAAVCHKMIAKEQQNRHQTAEEVIAALKSLNVGSTSGGVMPVDMATGRSPSNHTGFPSFAAEDEPLASIVARRQEQAKGSPVQAAWQTVIGWSKGRARWARWTSVTAATLLLVGYALWASGMLTKVKTRDGILIVEVNEPGAEVFVNGEKVKVTWTNGKRTATVSVPPGERQVEVQKDGFSAVGDKITIKEREREIFKAALEPTTAATPEGAGDGFDRKQFSVGAGKWWVEGNELLQAQTQQRFSLLQFGDRSWRDYDFTVDVTRAQGNGEFALMFRNGEDGRFYLLVAGTRQGSDVGFLEFQEPGSYSHVGGEFKFLIEGSKWYTAHVRARGDHIECFLGDGQNETKVVDLRERRYRNGRIGLRVFFASYRFRNIKVTAPDGTVLWKGMPNLEARKKLSDDKKQVVAMHPVEALKKFKEDYAAFIEGPGMIALKKDQPAFTDGDGRPQPAKRKGDVIKVDEPHGAFGGDINNIIATAERIVAAKGMPDPNLVKQFNEQMVGATEGRLQWPATRAKYPHLKNEMQAELRAILEGINKWFEEAQAIDPVRMESLIDNNAVVSGKLTDFSDFRPGWQSSNGQFISIERGDKLAVLDERRYTDFHLEADYKVVQGRGAVFVFHSEVRGDRPKGYSVGLGGSGNSLLVGGAIFRWEYKSGNINCLHDGNAAAARSMDTWASLDVTVRGNAFTAKINGEVVGTASDPNGNYRSGQIGFHAMPDSILALRNVRVRELEPNSLKPVPQTQPP